MKKYLIWSVMAVLASAAVLYSCKPKTEEPADDGNEATNSSDAQRVSDEMDNAMNDVNDAFNGTSRGARTGATLGTDGAICGATIDSSQLVSDKKLVLTFDGTTSCVGLSRKREGVITAQLTSGNKWADSGAVITITYTNYKVTRNLDGKYIIMNGTHVVTNTTGGLAFNLTSGSGSVIHTIRGNMSVTFDDGNTSSWKITRKRTITKDADGYVITIDGDSGTVAENGTGRYGDAFVNTITESIVLKQSCTYRPSNGTKVHSYTGAGTTLTAIFGVNAAGEEQTTGCPYGFKILYTTKRGREITAVINYLYN